MKKRPKTKKAPAATTRRRYATGPAERGAVDVRMRQLPTGDREDDPRFDGQTERALEAAGIDGELGPIVLPSAADAHRVLRELATLYHDRHAAARRHDALRTQLKVAAAALADLDARIAERIRVATHRTGLPLFAPTEQQGADLDAAP